MSRKCHLHLIKENMENAETITYFYCHGIKNRFWLSHYKNNLTSVKKNMLNLNELNIIVRNWYGLKVLWFELFSSHSRKCGDWFIGQFFIFGRKGGDITLLNIYKVMLFIFTSGKHYRRFWFLESDCHT